MRKDPGTEKPGLFCDGNVQAFRDRHNGQISEVHVGGFPKRAYRFEVPPSFDVDRGNICPELLVIQEAVSLFEAVDGPDKINRGPGGGAVETLLDVTHPIAVPGNPSCEKAVEKTEAFRAVQQQFKEQDIQMGNQQQMKIPGHEGIHLDEHKPIHDFRVTPKQLHGNIAAQAVTDKRYGGITHFEDKIPPDPNKGFNRDIRQGGAFPITRPGRSVNGIVVSEVSVTWTEGILISYPAVEKDERRSGAAFFIGDSAPVNKYAC